MRFGNMKPPLGSRIDYGHPLARGLKGCWLMNEGGGNKVYDLSGNGNTGTFGAGAASPRWTAGKYGSAVDFDTNDTLSVGSGITIGSQFSLVIWAKANSAYTGTNQQLFGIYVDANNRFYIRHPSGVPNLSVYSVINTNVHATGWIGVTVDTDWHQIVFVADGANWLHYYDGQFKNQSSMRALSELVGTPTIYLGGGGTGYFYNGQIDNALLYNNLVLSASEIAQLYREPFCMFGGEFAL